MERFLFGVENELSTAVRVPRPESVAPFPDAGSTSSHGVLRLLDALREEAPSLRSVKGGVFHGYGIAYLDCGHLELASAECDSPYLLPSLVERHETLLARASRRLEAAGATIHLANLNHAGLLGEDAPTWGAHENHLARTSPDVLSGALLPFLATRFYGGAGAVVAPGADYVASARALFLRCDQGGDTTSCRAILSHPRQARLEAGRSGLHRLHLICGDGLRSHFNLALQFGATALAVRVAEGDPTIPLRLARLRGLPGPGGSGRRWLRLMRSLNRLAPAGLPPRVPPLALDVQEVFLEAARLWAEDADGPPPWVPRLLDDWTATLDAARRGDRAWLAARLDAFAKYELLADELRRRRRSWASAAGSRGLLSVLAVLCHEWHAVAAPDPLPERFERAGLLEHRVGPRVAPGEEDEPFVPEVGTRARARARFLAEHARERHLVVDWGFVADERKGRFRDLSDPFATEVGPWGEAPFAARFARFLRRGPR